MYKDSKDFPIKSWLNVEIEQDCSFGWTIENIIPLLKDWSCVNAYVLVCHDEEQDVGVDPHCHLVINFKSPVPTHNILNRFESLNISFNQLEKIKSKRFASAVAYLTHENKPEKHQYKRDKLISYGIDINKAIDNEIALISNRCNINSIIQKIDKGEIKEYNITDFVDAVSYTKYKVNIDRAFHYRQLALEKERSGKRDMKCIFITGPADCGKSTYARQIPKNEHMSSFVSSSGKNPLDDYKGQECIILDDFRDDIIAFSDLLKLTDNNTQSFVGCRYYNKAIFECKMIIATSTKSITDLYQDNSEDKKQLYRRFPILIKMSEKYVDYYEYDIADNKYVHVGDTIWNKVYVLKMQKENNNQLVSSLADAMKNMSISNNPNSNYEELPNDDLPFVMPQHA